MKELLDLASWLSRHPRFRSLMRAIRGGGFVQVGPGYVQIGGPDGGATGWIWDAAGGSLAAPVVSLPPARITAAVHALRLRARQLHRRYPDA